ncbi:arsenate reductase (thioredoxin) [Companilactobacillus sp.]|jgi:arsenate reductase|uniref:arsenate reductase (thioredoxin) n=1 Tax=Companilactobacillus sp. TaxID=2767905 RepID=UPI0025BBC0AB|nr:arsenate reductase (thioredoxin) [Companilactobacillus sp.]MCH4009874.1 arsenate reductase (thioredoxin) [Companilactobacillus sp.]MCH4052450.1 arsenate reductase (thioredoxin) [Companilactobacillus sp.]MCH4077816.1 arsenate reductase (thioredoxin) [Companilactobacillus sp.]MCH4126392.1 arsenate reductase (thioredoxin) [Companilactobacillus sp.]MCI1312714.1 arsenate reductase (thioredoxin) [Companilactobacillus sp.]
MSDKKVYFICTGNSCRSQMAEGFAEKYFNSDWEIRSAGVETHGLNPLAVEVMAEVGIDISHHTSDLINNDFLQQCDLVVTLCGNARDKCPMTPSEVKRIHWPLPDPAQATGTKEQVLAVFRKVRDQINTNVRDLAQKYN